MGLASFLGGSVFLIDRSGFMSVVVSRCPKWSEDEKVCVRSVNNELHFYENNDFSEKLSASFHVLPPSAGRTRHSKSLLHP